MSHTFSDEAKKFEPGKFEERMPFGVNKVKLAGVTTNETDDGKPFLEVTVVNEDGLEDTTRVYFTEKAEPYSFATLKAIVVHNAKTDSDKEKARLAVENCVDLDELADLLNKKTVGGELWFTKYYDPTRTYTTENGTFKSINTNIYGYEPKPKPELMPKPKDEIHAVEDLGGEDVTGKVEIPGDRDWS